MTDPKVPSPQTRRTVLFTIVTVLVSAVYVFISMGLYFAHTLLQMGIPCLETNTCDRGLASFGDHLLVMGSVALLVTTVFFSVRAYRHQQRVWTIWALSYVALFILYLTSNIITGIALDLKSWFL